MRQLQARSTDLRLIPLSRRVLQSRPRAIVAKPLKVCAATINWFGLARPACETAAASQPQINFAPLVPKRCQRRSMLSLILPSAVASHPSIGCTAILLRKRDSGARERLPQRRILARITTESQGICRPRDCRCCLNTLHVLDRTQPQNRQIHAVFSANKSITLRKRAWTKIAPSHMFLLPHGGRRTLRAYIRINPNFLWLVDCRCCISESVLRRGHHFLWLPRFLSQRLPSPWDSPGPSSPRASCLDF